MSARARVVVAGAGFAGLETAYLLKMRLDDDVDVDVVAPDEHFVFRPNTIYLPFGGEVDALLVDLEKPLRKKHIGHHLTSAREIDTDRKLVEYEDGSRLPYDFLVVATGAAMSPEEIPGLKEHACTIWTIDEMLDFGRRLRRVVDLARERERQRVLLAVPPNNKCAGPLYEIVFMLDTWLRRQHVRDHVDIAFRTFEQSYIQAFGPRLHEVVAREFAERGIDGRIETPSSRSATARRASPAAERSPTTSWSRSRPTSPARASRACPRTAAGSSTPTWRPGRSSATRASTRRAMPGTSRSSRRSWPSSRRTRRPTTSPPRCASSRSRPPSTRSPCA
jgi:hypothetical protein